MEQQQQTTRVSRWKLAVTIGLFVTIGLGFAYLGQRLLSHYEIPLSYPALRVYAVIFGVAALLNMASFVPLTFHVSLMLIAAEYWNPVLIALFGSLGACLGEMITYYFGRIGKTIAIPDQARFFQVTHRWIQKYGMWAIALLSLQPVIPIEIGAFIAGTAKMPARRVILALWLGRFPKYLILIYAGATLMRLLPTSCSP